MTEPIPAAYILAAVNAKGSAGASMPQRICLACVESMPIDGAALSLMGKDSHPERVAASDEWIERIEDLQATLGEGPSFEVLAVGGPILISDLSAVRSHRWPVFVSSASSLEPSGLFVFPLQLGAVRLGVLTLYRRMPGPLPAEILAEALRVADVVAMLVLGRGAQIDDDFADQWLDESSWTREVHQATGMLISQLGVGPEEAFVRMRAYAFARNLALNEVARSIVARVLRLGDADGVTP